MMIAILVLLQAATPIAAGPADRDEVPRQKPTRCPLRMDDEGDIIVCGRAVPQEQFRLRPLSQRYDPVGGPGVGFRVGAGTGNVYAVTQQSPDGKPDKRLMVTVKLPF